MQFSTIVAGVMKWGVWGATFSTSDYEQIIRESIAAGVTTFDHADIYGHYTTEAEFGAVLGREPSLRTKMQLVTKCGIRLVTPNRPDYAIKSYDTSFEHIVASVDRSLKNLRTDYIDALLIHRPDFLMEADEVAKAFDRLKTDGKVLHFGVSNFTPSQVSLLHSRFPVEIHQIECSVLHLTPFLDGTLDQCQEMGILPMAWGALGSGNFFADEADTRIARVKAEAEKLAVKYGVSTDILLLSWLLRHPSGILPVIGTSKPERVRTAARAGEVVMEREDWYRLWTASMGAEVP